MVGVKQSQHYAIGLSLSVLRKPCSGKLFLNVLSWVICLIQIAKEAWSTTLTPTLYYCHRSCVLNWIVPHFKSLRVGAILLT